MIASRHKISDYNFPLIESTRRRSTEIIWVLCTEALVVLFNYPSWFINLLKMSDEGDCDSEDTDYVPSGRN